MPPQTSYSQTAIAAQPGQPFDAEVSRQDTVSRIASVNIAFGTYCELNSSGLAVPMQDATTLAGTVGVTNGSATATFSTAQTLPQGQALIFASQPGVIYYLAAALAAATAATLTQNYSGTTNASTTTSTGFNPNAIGIAMGGELSAEEAYVPFAVPASSSGSTASGWLKGQSVTFMRRGRIWAAGDATGTSLRYGAINVHHSSDGTHAQGVFTFSAVSPTAGNEIDVAPGVTVWNPDLAAATYTDPFGNTFNVYPVEVHL